MGNKVTVAYPPEFTNGVGTLLTDKGMNAAWSFYGPIMTATSSSEERAAEAEMLRKQDFKKSWKPKEYAMGIQGIPNEMARRGLLKPGKDKVYMRKVAVVNYEKLDMDKVRSLAPGGRGRPIIFAQYTDFQLIAAAHALGEGLYRDGLYKNKPGQKRSAHALGEGLYRDGLYKNKPGQKRSSATALVAAAAPVAVAAATGGLSGGGHRAQNRLLVALLIGLALWLLLKPTDREQ